MTSGAAVAGITHVPTIIALLDQSPLDPGTVRYAQLLAGAHGRLLLVRALPGPAPLDDGHQDALAAAAHQYLHRLAAPLRATPGISTHVFYGDESDAILEELFEHKADLVVLTIPAGHGFGGRATGSVAEHVLARSRVPVCVVRPAPGAPVVGWPGAHPRLLVPLDGSAFAEAVLPDAIDLARRLDGELVVLRVVPLLESLPPPGAGAWDVSRLDILQAEAGPYLSDIAQRCADAWPRVRCAAVRVGVPADAIVAAIREEQASMLMMATHAHSRWHRRLLGSVTDRVLRASSVPVVLLRPHALAAPDPGRDLRLVPGGPAQVGA